MGHRLQQIGRHTLSLGRLVRLQYSTVCMYSAARQASSLRQEQSRRQAVNGGTPNPNLTGRTRAPEGRSALPDLLAYLNYWPCSSKAKGPGQQDKAVDPVNQ